MQTLYSTFHKKFLRSFFIFLPLLFIPAALNADPFIEICYLDDCQYIEAGPEVNGCSGSDVVLYAIDPTSGDPCLETATYQWYTYDFYNTGNGWEYGWIMVVGATNNRYEVNNHGTFPYRCEVNCSGETYLTAEVEVSYNSSPPSVISHPESAEICEGTEVFLEGLGTGTNIVYQWESKIGTGLWTEIEGENASVLAIVPGIEDDGRSYRLKISNSCAYTVTASATVTVHPNPEPDLGDDIHICSGTSAVLGTSESYTSYVWNTAEETSEIHVEETGTYSVTVSSADGCTGSDEITVTVDPQLPEVNLGEDIVVCQGETVNLSVPDGYDSQMWSTGSTDPELVVSESGTYWLTVYQNTSVCETADTIKVKISTPYDQDHICMVTTDSESGNNLVIWERTFDVGILSYNVYRQSNVLGEYDLIGNVPADELSVFEDMDADPEVRQWVYKLTAIDTCGNESDIAVSPYHIPLFLQYVSSVNGVNLTWVPYEVQDGNMNFVSYVIFRGADSLKLESVGEISSDLTVYRDTDPKALDNKYYYRIAGVRADACTPAV